MSDTELIHDKRNFRSLLPVFVQLKRLVVEEVLMGHSPHALSQSLLKSIGFAGW